MQFSEKYRLNDWLKLQLALRIIKQIYPENRRQKLGLMLLLRSMNYNALIIQTGKDEHASFNLAVEINQPLFNSVVFNDNHGKLFGVLNVETGSFLSTLSDNKLGYFVDINQELSEMKNSLVITPSFYPLLPFKETVKMKTWTYNQKKYSLRFSLNQNLVAYFQSYPQMEIRYYFAHPLNRSLLQAVLLPLKKILIEEKLSGKNAVNFLLAFCHGAFEHKDDRETARGEHHNFVEETLYDTTSDCEDQSVLLAALIRGLLGYEVVGLEYPEHISLAIHAPDEKIPGTGYEYRGKLYMEADPSFIGCSFGDTQPELKNTLPKIIEVGKLEIVN
ncbi:hypothetical protein [Chloroherpeton thalassium]|nr:hypothetical protein [Chloroherpeton thalassium]